MSRLCLGYLILLHLASCSSHKFINNKMTDCELLSKMINQLVIIDEPPCNQKITIVVDTIGGGGSYVYDLGKIESVYKWNFDKCSNFYIKGFDSIVVVPLVYRFVHVEDLDLRIFPPDENTCFTIIISNITKYKRFYKWSITIENQSLDFSYLGSFLFNIDKSGNLQNIKIWVYRKNYMSNSGIDLSKKYPKYIQKTRY
ncbi:MAG: hypothetical protein IPN86_23935 [Saprospiraceae bacterium]|nr:hypothetical protein [Saprospiraceae bacterium]